MNQYTQRTVPGGIDVIGLANAGQSVSVNGSSADYRRGEYFQESVTVSNGASAVWQGVSVTTSGGGSASGNVFVAKTPELLSYDLDGNTVSDGRWDYLWDAENRLVSLVAKAALGQPLRLDFEYDTQGRRIRKRVWNNTGGTGSPTVERRYVYDGWNVLVELDGTNGVVQSYVWGVDLTGSLQGAGGVGGLVAVRPVGSPARFAVFDGNGNVMALVNGSTGQVDAHYEYGPFGEVLRASGAMSKANPFRFSTKYQDDETEFLYYGYRYYDARNGRWPNRDPINELGFQLLTRQRPEFNWDEERNVYAFAHNNGINRVDIDGRIAPVIVAAAAWAAWQGVCAYLAANKAVEAFPGDDKKQHCFASCFHNRCTGLFQPVFTLIGGALWELRPGGHADFDDVVADAYGIITSYHIWESCKTACDRCPVK